MKFKMNAIKFVIASFVLTAVISLPINVAASHSWGSYHWARTSNPFNLRVVDSNTTNWDGNKDAAITAWSSSAVLNLVNEAGDSSSTARKKCVMISGKIHSCNSTYGSNGWLGLASINISGNHITQGTSKMNDSYFNSPSYSNVNRQHVMCQEIGHTLGLDHQSTSGADLNTCMDYATALDNPNPNAHDYEQLGLIYAHLDSTTTIAFTSAVSKRFDFDSDEPHTWGRLVRQSANGRSSTYEHENWDGTKRATHVFWTEEAASVCRGCDHRYDH